MAANRDEPSLESQRRLLRRYERFGGFSKEDRLKPAPGVLSPNWSDHMLPEGDSIATTHETHDGPSAVAGLTHPAQLSQVRLLPGEQAHL